MLIIVKKLRRTQNEPSAPLNVLGMINIEHLCQCKRRIVYFVKTKELTPKQILAVACNTCGAAIGEVCELHTGSPRTEPHRDRKLSAAEAVDTKIPKR